MNTFIVLVVLTLGQCECYPIYVVPATYALPPVYTLRKDPLIYYQIPDREETRFYDYIYYRKDNKGFQRVPVINNYAPVIKEGAMSDGTLYIIYDYRDKIPYQTIMTEAAWRAKQVEKLAPEPKPVITRPLVPVDPPKQTAAIEPVITKPLAPVFNRDTVGDPLRRPSDVGSPERIISPRYEKD